MINCPENSLPVGTGFTGLLKGLGNLHHTAYFQSWHGYSVNFPYVLCERYTILQFKECPICA